MEVTNPNMETLQNSSSYIKLFKKNIFCCREDEISVKFDNNHEIFRTHFKINKLMPFFSQITHNIFDKAIQKPFLIYQVNY